MVETVSAKVIKSAYFLNNGMASVLTVLPDGKSVEVGLIGKEGFVGLPVVFGFKTSPLRVIIQADATAYRVDVTTGRFVPMLPLRRKTHLRWEGHRNCSHAEACHCPAGGHVSE